MCPDFTALHLLAIPAALHSTTVKISTLQSLTFSLQQGFISTTERNCSCEATSYLQGAKLVASQSHLPWPPHSRGGHGTSSELALFLLCTPSRQCVLDSSLLYPPLSLSSTISGLFFFFFWKCISSSFIWKFPTPPFSFGSPKISLFEALFPHGANV